MRTRHGCILVGALALAVGLASRAGAQGAPVFDHLKCYKVKSIDKQRVKGLVDLTPLQTQFFKEADCKIVGPKMLCVPVHKDNVRAIPPAAGAPDGPQETDHICYSLKCRKPFPPELKVTDQFATFNLRPTGTAFLCTPARKTGTTTTTSASTTSTTATTSTTMPPELCRDLSAPGAPPMCGGDCPATAPNCLFVGVDQCLCLPDKYMCMGAAGQCGGFCPNQVDSCIPDASGDCKCQPRCEDSQFPACGGGCPAGLDCRPTATGGQCICQDQTVDCGATQPPTCGGLCPPGLVCRQPSPTAGCVCLDPLP
jgi:hypothetical protein